MRIPEIHPSLSQWISANMVARKKQPVAEAASIAGETLRKLSGEKRKQIAEIFTCADEHKLAQDLIILGVCAIKMVPEVKVEYDPPVLLCDTVVAAKKEYPSFFRTLFNRRTEFVYSVWEIALKAACQRSARQDKGVGLALMEIIEAADTFIKADGSYRLPQLYAALPEQLSKWIEVEE